MSETGPSSGEGIRSFASEQIEVRLAIQLLAPLHLDGRCELLTPGFVRGRHDDAGPGVDVPAPYGGAPPFVQYNGEAQSPDNEIHPAAVDQYGLGTLLGKDGPQFITDRGRDLCLVPRHEAPGLAVTGRPVLNRVVVGISERPRRKNCGDPAVLGLEPVRLLLGRHDLPPG